MFGGGPGAEAENRDGAYRTGLPKVGLEPVPCRPRRSRRLGSRGNRLRKRARAGLAA